MEVDYERENGGLPCTVMEKEYHECIIDVAITLRGRVGRVSDGDVMGLGKRN